MIELKKEELLKNTIDYEDYSENVCIPTKDELEKAGLIQCGKNCSKCSCKSGGGCSRCKNKKYGN
ncbi:hypothetical protein [uncultured Clostridium sp.]|uniref:hypothetical protein n=1 Tax=uncultured Clostridium sp. TaxID=59620 RepID=UPI0025E762A6|nr:hypothetical protein [uncultured Clostridium sp.]